MLLNKIPASAAKPRGWGASTCRTQEWEGSNKSHLGTLPSTVTRRMMGVTVGIYVVVSDGRVASLRYGCLLGKLGYLQIKQCVAVRGLGPRARSLLASRQLGSRMSREQVNRE